MISRHREAIRTARSLVVKVGTTALTTPSGLFDAGRLADLADAIEGRMKAGSDVVIVSSGAIAAGLEPLGLSRRPRDLATKQAAASVGQVALVNAWSAAFARYGRTVGQVLLSAHDVSMRVQHTNAQRTLDRLRALHAVAIVNENDTVATNEIRFGDNDRLSALVAHLVGADALVLLSDIDGLYQADPRKKGSVPPRFIAEVTGLADLEGVVAGRSSHLGSGGMASKVSSALLAADAGVPVLVAPAADAATALTDASVGTVFAARPQRMSARRFWVRHAAESAGSLTLDEGAVRAVVRHRRSLLPAGITAVSGKFFGGDVVELWGPDSALVARGVVAYDAAELATMIGRSTSELPGELRRPAVHADDLVAVSARWPVSGPGASSVRQPAAPTSLSSHRRPGRWPGGRRGSEPG
ncbi:glutamate 5-kinase [Mycobacterium shinjukuense]|uniref:Glutamate 5-kinase n=1 Tax=Mycobacterium shinjukuense TaxID=398694 RepID=A0A7I7MKX7_9MYCO|nr:glutamate 5-kinase [Mycobacterium shinjukuense]BBX72868.1 glutamate 5-kinase [Mycobacterium shinjukuense]